MIFFLILATVVLISLISLVGAVALSIKKELLSRMLLMFVAFASGSMLAAAFLNLGPEAAEEIGSTAFTLILIGILFFFLIEKVIHWHHCNRGDCEVHPVVHLNLLCDGVHNFIDGVIIAAGFLTSVQVGFITALAIALHEIPQEIGDFAILVHGGLTKKRALLYNFISATTAIVGAFVGYMYLMSLTQLIPYILGIAAGGFVYIATADLMPELHKERTVSRLVLHTTALLVGVLLISSLSGIAKC